MALEQLLIEAKAIPYKELPEEEQDRLKMLKAHLIQSIGAMSDISQGAAPFYPIGMAARRGYESTSELERITEIHNFYIGQQYFPRQGESFVGPRAPANIR